MKIREHILRPSIERSMILMAILAIIESFQILVIVMLIFSFIPIPMTDFAKDLFPNNQGDLRPNRNMTFLHLWVGASFLIHWAGLWFFRGQLGQAKTDKILGRLIMVDGGWLLLQLFFVFKMILYPQASWVKPLFYVSLGLSLLSRVFWIEVKAFISKADEFLPRWASLIGVRLGMDVLILLFLFFSVWVFDLQRLWAVIDLAGNRALADQGWMALSPLIKGIHYSDVFPSLLILSLVYYGFFYLLLRRLFGSILLAGCGMFLAVKWQYFHNGIAPNIWQFPLKSIVPLLPDVFFWLCLLNHARTQKQWSLRVAGSILGIYLAYHFQTGVWLSLAWMAYLFLMRTGPVWYFFPWIAGLGLWFVFCGFHGTFDLIGRLWVSFSQILQGVGSLPYYDCLKGRNFFAFSVQFIIPVIYILTIIWPKQKENKVLMIPVSIYGLGLFMVHVWQPSLSNYYSVCSPLVIVICYWASQALALLPLTRRLILSSLLLIVYAGALLTNNVFGVYPNIWNVSGVNWEQVKAVHQQRMAGR